MERKHIITLTGKPGSGKSSTADKIAEMLGYTRYSSGTLVRSLLEKEGLTLSEYNKSAKSNTSLDDKIDKRLRELRNHNDIVIDARLGFYWIPESFKVYLDLDVDIATARIYNDIRDNVSRKHELTQKNPRLGSATDAVRKRVTEERSRFKKLYNIDPFDTTRFDLVIDTSRHSPDTVALTVYDHYRKWLVTENWMQVKSSVPLGYSFKNRY